MSNLPASNAGPTVTSKQDETIPHGRSISTPVAPCLEDVSCSTKSVATSSCGIYSIPEKTMVVTSSSSTSQVQPSAVENNSATRNPGRYTASTAPIVNGIDHPMQKEPSSGFMILSVKHETKTKRDKKSSYSGFDQPAVLPKKGMVDSELTAKPSEESTPSAGEEEDEETDDDEDEDDDEDSEASEVSPCTEPPLTAIPNYSAPPGLGDQPGMPPTNSASNNPLGQQTFYRPFAPVAGKAPQLSGTVTPINNQNVVYSKPANTNKPWGPTQPTYNHNGTGMVSVPPGNWPPSHNGVPTSNTNLYSNAAPVASQPSLPPVGPAVRSSEEATPTPTPVATLECSSATSPPTIDFPEGGEGVGFAPASRFRKARIQERIEHWREGRSCFNDCRVKTVPSKVLDLVRTRVDPVVPMPNVTRCAYCLGRVPEYPCYCSESQSSSTNSKKTSTVAAPYVGGFWYQGERTCLYIGPVHDPLEPSLDQDVANVVASIPMDVDGKSSSRRSSSTDQLAEEPVELVEALQESPHLATRSQEHSPVPMDMADQAEQLRRRKVDSHSSDICPEQPAPPTSPASGLSDRLLSPGTAVEMKQIEEVPQQQQTFLPPDVIPTRPVQAVQPAPAGQPQQQHTQNTARNVNMSTSMAAYPEHRPPTQAASLNGSFENRVEARINASLDVVRMALMTTFREEMEALRSEIAYLREQSRVNQENWERTFSFLRQYVPAEVWEQVAMAPGASGLANQSASSIQGSSTAGQAQVTANQPK